METVIGVGMRESGDTEMFVVDRAIANVPINEGALAESYPDIIYFYAKIKMDSKV